MEGAERKLTSLPVISLQNDWYAINYNGSTGYISSDYLKVYTGSAASGTGASIAETAMSYLGPLQEALHQPLSTLEMAIWVPSARLARMPASVEGAERRRH